jgi:hypothetical protein
MLWITDEVLFLRGQVFQRMLIPTAIKEARVFKKSNPLFPATADLSIQNLKKTEEKLNTELAFYLSCSDIVGDDSLSLHRKIKESARRKTLAFEYGLHN